MDRLITCAESQELNAISDIIISKLGSVGGCGSQSRLRSPDAIGTLLAHASLAGNIQISRNRNCKKIEEVFVCVCVISYESIAFGLL